MLRCRAFSFSADDSAGEKTDRAKVGVWVEHPNYGFRCPVYRPLWFCASAIILSAMRLSRKLSWAGGLLFVALGGCWLIGTLFPDQVFLAYHEASRWSTVMGPVPSLPVPDPIRDDGVRTFHEDSSRKPFVVLPVRAAAEMIRGRGWEPTDTEIAGLEASLPLVPHLRAENWLPRYDLRIDHPDQYFRQYFPVVWKGKKLVYVNAFRDESPDWRQRLVIIMDGGTRCWQAYYDPAAHAFLSLRINGVA